MTRLTTPPAAWADAIDRHAPPPLCPHAGRVVVVAAHPDDETLGAGGFLHASNAAGAQIELVVATDGEAAFGAPDPDLGRARWAELREALDDIGLHRFVGRPAQSVRASPMIDLFAGCGGMIAGFVGHGFMPVLACRRPPPGPGEAQGRDADVPVDRAGRRGRTGQRLITGRGG